MIMLDDFEKIKREVAELERRAHQATGAFNQIMKRLKKEFGCATIKEAEALLEKKKKRELIYAKKWMKMKKVWLKKYKHLLEKVDE